MSVDIHLCPLDRWQPEGLAHNPATHHKLGEIADQRVCVVSGVLAVALCTNALFSPLQINRLLEWLEYHKRWRS